MNTLRVWLSNRLHLWAARLHDDFHTIEVTASEAGQKFRFSCNWQWIASSSGDWDEDCSCEREDLR